MPTSKVQTAIALSLFAGLFTASYAVLDIVVLRRGIMPSVPLYAMTGGFILLGLTWLMGALLGHTIDTQFDGYKLRWLSSRWVIATALSGALLTITYLYALDTIADPSVIVPVEQTVVLVLLFWEWARTQILRRTGALPANAGGRVRKTTWLYAVLIVVGSILVSRNTASVFVSFADWRTFGLLGLLVLFLALYIKMKHIGLSSGIDQTNFRLWWLVWMVPLLWIYGMTFGGFRQKEINLLFSVSVSGYALVLGSMMFVYASFVFELKARKLVNQNQAWLIAAVMAVSIPAVFLINLLGLALAEMYGPDYYPFGPHALQQLPRDIRVWLMRSVGAAAIALGAIQIGRGSE